jgi:hypothetical protein
MFPLMHGFASPLNISEVSGRDSLQGIYKDSFTYNNLSVFYQLPTEGYPQGGKFR